MGKTIVIAALVLANPPSNRTQQTEALKQFTSRLWVKGPRGKTERGHVGSRQNWTEPPQKILAYKPATRTVKRLVKKAQGNGMEMADVEETYEARDPDNDRVNPEWKAWTKPPTRVDVHATLIVAPTTLLGQVSSLM